MVINERLAFLKILSENKVSIKKSEADKLVERIQIFFNQIKKIKNKKLYNKLEFNNFPEQNNPIEQITSCLYDIENPKGYLYFKLYFKLESKRKRILIKQEKNIKKKKFKSIYK